MSKQLQEAYESMPQEAKDDFWRHLEEALKWRGQKMIGQKAAMMSQRSLFNLADVLYNEAGACVEEYT